MTNIINVTIQKERDINVKFVGAEHAHSNKTIIDAIQEALTSALKTNYDSAYSHISLTNNPHSVNKTQVGLGNVPNLDTTDAVNNAHTHSNKTTLDSITEAFTTALKSNYDTAYSNTHSRQHSITSASDHTSTATPGKILKADANGLPTDATNTDTEVSGAVTNSHTHSNKSTLDSIQVALTSALKTNYDSAYSHISLTNNPHSVTKTQVSLGNVTNDAQLKRAAGDINSFTLKSTPVSTDIVLIEDSADTYNKKKATVLSLGGTNYDAENGFEIIEYTAP